MSDKAFFRQTTRAFLNADKTPKLLGDIVRMFKDISGETVLVIKSTDLIGDLRIEAKLDQESDADLLFIVSGNIDTTIDISLYNELQIIADTDITSGKFYASGFRDVGTSSGGSGGGDATAANQVTSNTLLSQIEVNQDSQTVLLNSINEGLDCTRWTYTYTVDGLINTKSDGTNTYQANYNINNQFLSWTLL